MGFVEKLCIDPRKMPCDVVRGQIICKSMEDMCCAIETVRAQPSMQIVRMKNKFKDKPSGWADVTLNVTFDGVSDLAAEIQLVHADMMVVRENLKEHNRGYAKVRFVNEVRLLPARQVELMLHSFPSPSRAPDRSLK